MLDHLSKESHKIIIRIFYMMISAVVFMQLGETPLWLSTIYGVCLFWSYLHVRFKVAKPGINILIVSQLILVAILALSYSFRMNLSMFKNIMCIWIIFDVLHDISYKRIHLSGFKIISLLSIELLFSRSPWFTLLYISVCIMVVTSMFLVNNGLAGNRSIRQRLIGLLKLTMRTIPLVVILFIMIPGILDLSYPAYRKNRAQTGIGNYLDPAKIAKLGQDSRRAFSVEVLKGDLPSRRQLYWRAKTVSLSRGLEWRPYKQKDLNLRSFDKTATKLRIVKEDISGDGIFSLSQLIQIEPEDTSVRLKSFEDGTAKLVAMGGSGPTEYIVFHKDKSPYVAFDKPKDIHLQLPRKIGKDVWSVVESLSRVSRSQSEYAQKLIEWFREEKFSYTLNPGVIDPPSIGQFLKVKKGFCGHFAAVFANMMRMNGIPARIVLGYHGGQLNPFTNKYRIAGSDAHAWVEVFLRTKPVGVDTIQQRQLHPLDWQWEAKDFMATSPEHLLVYYQKIYEKTFGNSFFSSALYSK